MARLSYDEFFERHGEIFNRFDDVVSHWQNFGSELRRHDFFTSTKHLLSIGCGKGKLEIAAAKEFDLALTIVEPAQSYCDEFKSMYANHGLREDRREIFHGSFEEFDSESKFDRVVSVHSWYAFGLNESLLRKALGYRAPSGKLFVTIISESSLTWKIAEHSKEIPGSELSAEALSKWASDGGYEHEFFLNRLSLPRKTFFTADDELTEDARAFCSFLRLTPWKAIPRAQQEALKNLLHAEVVDEQITLRCGCLLFQ